jgi:hypothetical protein
LYQTALPYDQCLLAEGKVDGQGGYSAAEGGYYRGSSILISGAAGIVLLPTDRPKFRKNWRIS